MDAFPVAEWLRFWWPHDRLGDHIQVGRYERHNLSSSLHTAGGLKDTDAGRIPQVIARLARCKEMPLNLEAIIS
jgi:hypothetical protein